MHRKHTGTDNLQILENAGRFSDQKVRIRVPLIPGLTDTYDNLRDIFDFMSEVGLPSVSLLSYNASASAKYEWWGMKFSLEAETQT
mgnify:CR=1 FL=1